MMASDNQSTLHIRCGSDIESKLKAAGFDGDFLDFSDPFCQGPVHALPEDEFIAERTAFIAGAYGLDETEVVAKQAARYGALADAGRYATIVLWFEHDSFDQLILAYLLNHFANQQRLPRLELICIDDYPVLPRFIGLGQLGADDLKILWPGRVVLTPEHLAFGQAVWAALTAASPEALAKIIRQGTPLIPPMARALDRHLDELPSTRHGLGLTETLALRILAENGALSGADMFKRLLHRYEPLPYLGDQMFGHELDRLLAGGAAALVSAGTGWADRVLKLSDLGEEILMTEEDWLDHMPGPRVIGGIAITPKSPTWRRDAKGRLVFFEPK